MSRDIDIDLVGGDSLYVSERKVYPRDVSGRFDRLRKLAVAWLLHTPAPALLRVRVLSTLPLPEVPSMCRRAPGGILVEPDPDIVPPVQVSTDVAVRAAEPAMVPPEKVAVTTEALLVKLAVPELTRSVWTARGLLAGRLAVPPVT